MINILLHAITSWIVEFKFDINISLNIDSLKYRNVMLSSFNFHAQYQSKLTKVNIKLRKKLMTEIIDGNPIKYLFIIC